jgi:bifunctional DNase/RNase
MPAETIPLALELEVPLTVVHELVKQHLLASLTSNGHATRNGHAPTAEAKEAAAPVLPSSTGAP